MEFLTQFIGHFAHAVAKAASVPHKFGTVGIAQFAAGSSRRRGKVFEQIARDDIVQLVRQADGFAEMFRMFRGGRTGKGFDQINGFASKNIALFAFAHVNGTSQNYSGMSNSYYKELCQGIWRGLPTMKMLTIITLGIWLSAASFAPAHAAENCKDPQTQADMNICSGKAFEEADKKLNETYQKALKILEESDKEKIEDFKDAQRAWIKFRDLNCKYAADGFEGGSMAPLVHSSCMEKLTQQRIEQIPELFAEWE